VIKVLIEVLDHAHNIDGNQNMTLGILSTTAAKVVLFIWSKCGTAGVFENMALLWKSAQLGILFLKEMAQRATHKLQQKNAPALAKTRCKRQSADCVNYLQVCDSFS
jgi:hypothetical protein